MSMWSWCNRQSVCDSMFDERGRTKRRTGWSAVVVAAIASATGLGACQDLDATEPAGPAAVVSVPEVTAAARHDDRDHDKRCNWEQWGGNPAHTGAACEEVDHFQRISAHLTFDPFLDQELADAAVQAGAEDLFTHFQAPLLVDNDVYMEFKAGTYTSCASVPAGAPCGRFAWNSQVWTERAFHWSDGRLVADWTFESDWKPEPGQLAAWEPVFHAVVVGPFLYVPGASGSVHKLDRRTGTKLATIRLPGVGADPDTYVAGGLAADALGNVYYNALALVAGDPIQNPRGAWLVKVHPDNRVTMAAFQAIVVGAPAATDTCAGQFPFALAPLPPAPDAVAPSVPCGAQRPALNVTPAIGADGTVVTVSRAHLNPSYSFVVAVDANLRPRWATSLRDQLSDGCGVATPSDATSDTTDPFVRFTHCRVGTRVGVDPTTNLAPAGQANDQGSSSPVILPDGGVLYGAFTRYNQARGHLFKLDRHGRHAATYDFGWDVTPAVYRHDGTYSIIIKDNFYFDAQFYISQLDASLHREWTVKATNTQSCHRDAADQVVCEDTGEHPTGFEWCVNAPAVDPSGNVYVNSEDGWVYKIAQGGRFVDRTFLLQPLGAAYTPISIDGRGRLFSLNGGDLFVIGGHGERHGHD
jgi:hypothetical protein